MPATAVGSANGSSMSPSSNHFPGKSYFTSVHATMSPNTTFTIAAINDEVMLVIKAFLTFSFMISATKSPGDIFSEYTSTDASGMSTMTESIVTTIPSERW